MMFYENTKVMISSPNNDTDFFNIVVGVLQGDNNLKATTNANWSNEIKKSRTKNAKKQIIKHFSEIHQHKPNPCCKVYGKQFET